jgi:hypothetical protein
LVGFVNGLPLVVIELKKPGVPARAAFDENLTHYKSRIDTSPLIPPDEPGRRCSCSTRCSSPRTARTGTAQDDAQNSACRSFANRRRSLRMDTDRVILGKFFPQAIARNRMVLVPLLALLGPGRMSAALVQSDGSDGPFHPVASQTLVLSNVAPDGVFNFTTIHIPSNVTIRFANNPLNTPVFFAATGDVTIEGTIDISGQDFSAGSGPGGWRGGAASPNAAGSPGSGPAGGERGSPPVGQGNAGGGAGMATPGLTATSRTGGNPGKGGPKIRRPALVPGQIGGGGSGGGGGGGRLYFGVNISGGDGGGGGGAMQISTPARLTLNGKLVANGGHGAWAFANVFARGGPGGGGAGGHFELFANELVVGTNASIQVRGGAGGGLSTEPVPNAPFVYSSGANGGLGYVYFNCTNNIPSGLVSEGVVDVHPEILSLAYSNLTGQVSLVFRGLTCTPYTMQSSTNLADWLDRTNPVSCVDGLFYWSGENPTNLPGCFYRVRQP